jgi:hypothetical protein
VSRDNNLRFFSYPLTETTRVHLLARGTRASMTSSGANFDRFVSEQASSRWPSLSESPQPVYFSPSAPFIFFLFRYYARFVQRCLPLSPRAQGSAVSLCIDIFPHDSPLPDMPLLIIAAPPVLQEEGSFSSFLGDRGTQQETSVISPVSTLLREISMILRNTKRYLSMSIYRRSSSYLEKQVFDRDITVFDQLSSLEDKRVHSRALGSQRPCCTGANAVRRRQRAERQDLRGVVLLTCRRQLLLWPLCLRGGCSVHMRVARTAINQLYLNFCQREKFA